MDLQSSFFLFLSTFKVTLVHCLLWEKASKTSHPFPLGSFTGTNGQGEVLGFSDSVFGVTADFNTHNKWEGILKDQQLGQPGPLSEMTMEEEGDMAGMLHRQTSNCLCSFYTK